MSQEQQENLQQLQNNSQNSLTEASFQAGKNCLRVERFPLDKNEYTPAHIANYLLYKAHQDGVAITPMKLIKLVYIAYGWYLVREGKRLFADKIEAWRYGPVVPSLYHEFKRFGSNPVDTFAVEFSVGTSETSFPIAKDQNVLMVVNAVWQFYCKKTGEELSKITHENNSAWSEAWQRSLNSKEINSGGSNPGISNSELKDELIAARSAEGIRKFLDS